MASTECGWCGRLAHMTAASTLRVFESELLGSHLQAAYACPNCLRLNIATEPTGGRNVRIETHPVDVAHKHQWGPFVSWIPKKGKTRQFPDVPEHIASAATEATLCLSMGAFRAVGSLARAVIEATAKDKQVGGSNLNERIEALSDAEHIRRHTKEQAHEIRHFGNDMAHGDFADPTTEEEATEIIELMAEVLQEVYQSPARLAKLREAREAKKKPNDA